MSEADVYFDGEVAALRDKAIEVRSAAREKMRRDAEAMERSRRRREHTIEAERGEVCLLDLDPETLLAALDAHPRNCIGGFSGDAEMRSARTLYLAGRKAEAADVLYPRVRDALGVAV